jgi:hypothetical protein
VGEVGFGDEHNVDVVIREKGAELVGVVENMVGVGKLICNVLQKM